MGKAKKDKLKKGKLVSEQALKVTQDTTFEIYSIMKKVAAYIDGALSESEKKSFDAKKLAKKVVKTYINGIASYSFNKIEDNQMEFLMNYLSPGIAGKAIEKLITDASERDSREGLQEILEQIPALTKEAYGFALEGNEYLFKGRK